MEAIDYSRLVQELENQLAKRDETIDALYETNKELWETNKELSKRVDKLESENEEIRELLKEKAESKASKKPKFSDYSLEKNGKGESGKGKKKRKRKRSTGRRSQARKRVQVEREENVHGSEGNQEESVLHRQQFAWRIVDGKAVYICYSIYDSPGSKSLPVPEGLRNSRSEFGIEIILILAFLHYWVGISLDHAREVLKFFTGLDLAKSQANSLLTQLANDWNKQYDSIAELIALQLIVYIDETGWKIGKSSCYTWVFSTTMHVLFRCGVGRGKAEAEAVVGKLFPGIGVTDDYSAYKNLFTEHQLCWAHLIRKAIKLALQNPDEKQYAKFLDELCEIYKQAIRYQNDGRLSVGRPEKDLELQEMIRSLCTRAGEVIDKDKMPKHEGDFIRLQNELADNLSALFVFVRHPEVERTNNRSERNVRREAEVRKGGRTSKSEKGAKRRGVIMTVITSLQTRFEKFTLDALLKEVAQWLSTGRSVFQAELEELQTAKLAPSG